MESKVLKRLGLALTGMAMAIGVGVGLSQRGEYKEVRAASATLAYNTATTTNMTGGNDAATLGLNASNWSVVGAKGAASNFPGLNKNKYIALYYHANGCNTLTVTSLQSYTISSIVITYYDISKNNGVVKVGNVTKADSDASETTSTHSINSTSFVVTNGNTSNVQVQIKSIVITYSTGGATLSSMTVTTQPTKKTYNEGEAFDATNMVITGTYSDSSTAPIANNNISWSKSGVLTAGQTSLIGTYEGVQVTVTGLTVNQLAVSSMQTVYETAIALGSGNSGTTYYRYAGVVTGISGSNVFMQDVTGGYPVCVFDSTIASEVAVGKKLTIVSTLQDYYDTAEPKTILTYSISDNDGAAISATDISTISAYNTTRKGLLVNLKGLARLAQISATYNTTLLSTDTLGFGEDAISYNIYKTYVTENMVTTLNGILSTDIIDLNNVIRFKNKDRDGVDFLSASTVTVTDGGSTPATSITLNSDASVSIAELETSQIDAELDALATDQTITYTSNNESVATVNETGLITGVGVGSTTITVASHSTPSVNTSVSVTVTARVWTANAYNKVFKDSEITSGAKYIIVYETNSTSGYSFNGYDVNNGSASVTISSGTIVPNAQIDEGVLTISTYSTGYSIQLNSHHGTNASKYLSGTSGKNVVNFESDAQLNTISISDGVATITSNTSFVQYNSNKRFRYYQSGTTTQSDVCLYKYVDGTLSTDQFAAYLENSTTAICGTDGTSANHYESLNKFWAYISDKYNELSSDDKASLKTMEALEGGTNLQDALARYDHMMIRYKTSGLTDFAGRFAEGGINYSSRGFAGTIDAGNDAVNNLVIVIIIVAGVSALAIGGYFFIRRRKER